LHHLCNQTNLPSFDLKRVKIVRLYCFSNNLVATQYSSETSVIPQSTASYKHLSISVVSFCLSAKECFLFCSTSAFEISTNVSLLEDRFCSMLSHNPLIVLNIGLLLFSGLEAMSEMLLGLLQVPLLIGLLRIPPSSPSSFASSASFG
jgi:hypothetical protein